MNVNSGSIESEGEKQKTTKYGKIAKAIGDMQQVGVIVEHPSINDSEFTFKPNEETNKILFGLKGINGIGDDIVDVIIKNRPYTDLNDFIEKTKLDVSQMISLIKSGSFDSLLNKDRRDIMTDYFNYLAIDGVKRSEKLTMASLNKLIDYDLIPQQHEKAIVFYRFLNYVDDKRFFSCKVGKKNFNVLDERAKNFFEANLLSECVEDTDYLFDGNGNYVVCVSAIKKIIEKNYIEKLKDWITSPQTAELLYSHSLKNFIDEKMNKYCDGTISKWEMDSISFYYHEHELSSINKKIYDIVDFNSLSDTPNIVETYKYRGREFYKFGLNVIAGTVLDKNKNKHIVSILTMTGVVNLKFSAGAYSYYDKQLSELNQDTNKKTITEKSWFTRGNKILVVGYRQDNLFIPKRYSNSVYQHTVMKINELREDGTLILQLERNYGENT